jgi:hypothetical protein
MVDELAAADAALVEDGESSDEGEEIPKHAKDLQLAYRIAEDQSKKVYIYELEKDNPHEPAFKV